MSLHVDDLKQLFANLSSKDLSELLVAIATEMQKREIKISEDYHLSKMIDDFLKESK